MPACTWAISQTITRPTSQNMHLIGLNGHAKARTGHVGFEHFHTGTSRVGPSTNTTESELDALALRVVRALNQGLLARATQPFCSSIKVGISIFPALTSLEGSKFKIYIMTIGVLAPYRRLGIGAADAQSAAGVARKKYSHAHANAAQCFLLGRSEGTVAVGRFDQGPGGIAVCGRVGSRRGCGCR
eukprot:6178306-Pleurochrysis_carterae.AAC.4